VHWLLPERPEDQRPDLAATDGAATAAAPEDVPERERLMAGAVPEIAAELVTEVAAHLAVQGIAPVASAMAPSAAGVGVVVVEHRFLVPCVYAHYRAASRYIAILRDVNHRHRSFAHAT
jgi:hypothetical protein